MTMLGAYFQFSSFHQWKMKVGRTIDSSQEVYIALCQTLHRSFEEMPFSYADYLKDFPIIGVDLILTDGNLHVLPTALTGNLRVEMQFQQNNQDVTIFYFGEFQNRSNSILNIHILIFNPIGSNFILIQSFQML